MPAIAIAAYALLLAACGGVLVARDSRPQEPRTTYSRHVLGCEQCSRLDAPLCPQGEQMRRQARDADGLVDPALDR
jgi:hypothetical protein